MEAAALGAGSGSGYEVRFESLFDPGRGLAFPCDAAGRVELARLSERARRNYLHALAVVGRDYAVPAVSCADGAH